MRQRKRWIDAIDECVTDIRRTRFDVERMMYEQNEWTAVCKQENLYDAWLLAGVMLLRLSLPGNNNGCMNEWRDDKFF